MKLFLLRNRKKAAKTLRGFVVLLVLLALLAPPKVNAAVPTWVVAFDAGTDYERSLEKFLFDLFGTLQERQEDFTAAFELQKIEKAREDVNKLFQETLEELQDFGQALDETTDTATDYVRDPRFVGTGLATSNCSEAPGEEKGCPPTISPIKDSRIIHDPYQYLFGDANTKAQIFLYCFFDYLIWDQMGWLDNRYPEILKGPSFNARKATYDPLGRLPNAGGTQASIEKLLRTRNELVVQFHRNHYYLLNYPLQEIYGYVGAMRALKDGDQAGIPTFNKVEPRCRQAMYVVGGESPVTIEQDVNLWNQLMRSNLLDVTAEDKERFRKLIWFLPTLRRGIGNRVPGDGWTWTEFSLAKDPRNRLDGIRQLALSGASRIMEETQTERQATYIAGQGIRPENLYVANTQKNDNGTTATFNLNTEYVISPAVVLLQKMQAANQAMFDLAGQGFLYLDPEETPPNILAAYRVSSTSGNDEERSICNNAGDCALLSPWLKPIARFRTAAEFKNAFNDKNKNGKQDLPAEPTYSAPLFVGSLPDSGPSVPGSGLPAPWEDPASFLDIGNEKDTADPKRRYTIARFRLVNRDPSGAIAPGQDEFDPGGKTVPHQDNIGRPALGTDYPTNDWYDRVIEMYEAGIGFERKPSGAIDSQRDNRIRDFTVQDWQCYIALWFIPQNIHANADFEGGVTFFVGEGSGNAAESAARAKEFLTTYCGV